MLVVPAHGEPVTIGFVFVGAVGITGQPLRDPVRRPGIVGLPAEPGAEAFDDVMSAFERRMMLGLLDDRAAAVEIEIGQRARREPPGVDDRCLRGPYPFVLNSKRAAWQRSQAHDTLRSLDVRPDDLVRVTGNGVGVHP